MLLWRLQWAAHPMSTTDDMISALIDLRRVALLYGRSEWAHLAGTAVQLAARWPAEKTRAVCRDMATLVRDLDVHHIPGVLASHVYVPCPLSGVCAL